MSDNSKLPNPMQEYFRAQQREIDKEQEQFQEKRLKEKAKEDAAQKKLDERAREEAMKSPEQKVWSLFFITHFNNLQSILKRGILSPANVRGLGLHPVRIDDEEVNDRRNKTMVTRHLLPACQPKLINAGQCAHAFFNPCNAMFHVVLGKHHPKNIVIIEVSINVSDRGVYITDRNVAKSDVQCWDSSQYHKIIPQIERDTLPIGRTWDHSPVWCNDGSLSMVMAECLVQDKISRDHFKSIHVNSNDMIEKVQPLLVASPELEIIVDQSMFFNGQYD